MNRIEQVQFIAILTQLPKHQSPLPTTVLPKTTLTQMLRQCNRVLSLGSNHLLNGKTDTQIFENCQTKEFISALSHHIY